MFRKLHFVPISPCYVVDSCIRHGHDTAGMIPMLRDIYHEHGWPDLDRYDMSKCLKAVRAAMQETYPRIGVD